MKTYATLYTEELRARWYKAAYRFAKRHGFTHDKDTAAEEFRSRHNYYMGGSHSIISNIEWAIHHGGDTVDRKMEAAFKRVFCRAVRIPYNRKAYIYAGMIISPGK